MYITAVTPKKCMLLKQTSIKSHFEITLKLYFYICCKSSTIFVDSCNNSALKSCSINGYKCLAFYNLHNQSTLPINDTPKSSMAIYTISSYYYPWEHSCTLTSMYNAIHHFWCLIAISGKLLFQIESQLGECQGKWDLYFINGLIRT